VTVVVRLRPGRQARGEWAKVEATYGKALLMKVRNRVLAGTASFAAAPLHRFAPYRHQRLRRTARLLLPPTVDGQHELCRGRWYWFGS
jgi:hypothetical protein